jgi:hypothetical protein
MEHKLLIQNKNIQIAIDQNNKVWIRIYGRGYKGDCWGTWNVLDFNPKEWTKLVKTTVRTPKETKAQGISQSMLDTVDVLLDLTK